MEVGALSGEATSRVGSRTRRIVRVFRYDVSNHLLDIKAGHGEFAKMGRNPSLLVDW